MAFVMKTLRLFVTIAADSHLYREYQFLRFQSYAREEELIQLGKHR